MKTRVFLIFCAAGLLGASGCSTPPLHSPISFSKVASVDYGKTKTTDIRHSIGAPDNVVKIDDQTTLWSYNDHLTLTIDPVNDLVLGAVWIPHTEDALAQKEEVLKQFKSANFKMSYEGWIAKHHYSRDEIYTDREYGISFQLGSTHRTVQAIAFSQPTAVRQLSTQ